MVKYSQKQIVLKSLKTKNVRIYSDVCKSNLQGKI